MRLPDLPLVRAFRQERVRFMAALVLLAAAVTQHVSTVRLAWDYWMASADYHTYLTAGRYFWAGQPTYLLAEKLGPHSDLYPPTFFLLLWPWTAMPDVVGRLTWMLLLHGALFAIILMIYSEIGKPTRAEGICAIALVLLSLPVGQSITEGQAGVLVAALVVAMFVLDARGRRAAPGVSLAFAVMLKLVPLLLGPYLLWRRRPRVLATAAAVLAGVFLATLAVGWAPRWQGYWDLVSSVSAGTPFPANQSIDGFLLRLFYPAVDLVVVHPSLTFRLFSILAKVALVGLVVILVRRVRSHGAGRWVEVSLVLLALPMLQPFSWIHHWTIALVAIPVAANAIRQGRLRGAVLVWCLVALGLSMTPRLGLYLGQTIAAADSRLVPLQVWLSSWWLLAMLVALLTLGLGYKTQPRHTAGEGPFPA